MPLCSPGWYTQDKWLYHEKYFHSWDCFLSTGAEIEFFRSLNWLSIPGRNNEGKCIFNKCFTALSIKINVHWEKMQCQWLLLFLGACQQHKINWILVNNWAEEWAEGDRCHKKITSLKLKVQALGHKDLKPLSHFAFGISLQAPRGGH